MNKNPKVWLTTPTFLEYNYKVEFVSHLYMYKCSLKNTQTFLKLSRINIQI